MSLQSILSVAARALIAVGLVAVQAPAVRGSQEEPPPPDAIARRDLPPLPEAAGNDTAPDTAFVEAQTLPWTKVVFQTYRDGNWEVYIGDDGGANERRLTYDGNPDVHPQLRRGGDRVVFASKRDGDYEIFAVNVDGSQLTQLTFDGTDDVNPAWSPDGTQIAFQSYRDGQAEVYIMNADGSGQARLTNDADYDGEPNWSPDATQLAFVSRRSGGYRVYVMPAGGGAATGMSNQAYSGHPIWSPDGNTISYEADGNNDGWLEIWFVDADGTDQRNVITLIPQHDAINGGWAPDNRYLAYTAVHYINYQGNWYWTDATNWAYGIGFIHGPRLTSGTTDWNFRWQSTDSSAPQSQLTGLPAASPGPIHVSWSANEPGGSGVRGYSLEVSEGAGPWQAWLSEVTTTSADYPGQGGHTYSFRIRAWDWSFNIEPWPSVPNATTTVEALPPGTAASSLQPFVRGGALISWGGSDPGGSGIANYDVQYRVGLGGAWTTWQSATIATSRTFTGTAGQTLYFRSRGRDRAGNVEDWPAGDGDTHVTFYSWLAAGSITDHSGTPLVTAGVSSSPNLLAAPVGSGTYALYGLTAIPAYAAAWSRPGYSSVPATVLSTTQDQLWNIVLPPADNPVQNWGFEAGLTDWAASGSVTTSVLAHSGAAALHLGPDTEFALDEAELVSYYSSGFQFYYPTPDIAVDREGTVHVVWSSHPTNENEHSSYSSLPRGGVWSAPVTLPSPGLNGYPVIEVDADLTVHVLQQGYDHNYTYKPLNGDWSALVPVGAFGYGRDLALDAEGGLHAVWPMWTLPGYSHQPAIAYATKPAGGNWSGGTVYWDWGVEVDAPTIAVAADGTEYVSFSPRAGYYTRAPGGDWSNLQQLGGAGASHYSLAVDGQGVVHAVWIEPGSPARVVYASKLPGGDWSLPATVAVNAGYSTLHLAVSNDYVYLAASTTGHIDLYVKYPGRNGWTQPVTTANLLTDDSMRVVVEPGGAPHVVFTEVGDNRIMYRGPALAEAAATAAASQAVTVPAEGPHLSFLFRLSAGSAPDGAGLYALVNGTEVFSRTVGTEGWTHAVVDLSAWAGQSVTLRLETRQVAGQLPVFGDVDEVSLGRAYPDVWVSTADASTAPGQALSYRLTYGNRGAVPASGTVVSLTLPAEVAFVSAIPAPVVSGNLLTWSAGTLPAHSGPFTITVRARASASALVGANLPHILAGSTDASELELLNNLQNLVTHMVSFRILVPVALR